MRLLITIILLVLLYPWEALSAQVGLPAPTFSTADLSKKMVTLGDFKDTVVLLTFWAPWCAPCRDELPEFERLYKKYHDKGFTVIGISVEPSESGVSSFLKKVPVTFPIVIDDAGHIAEAYRISGLPASFLIDRSGAVHKRYWGFEKQSLSAYESDITGLLNQK